MSVIESGLERLTRRMREPLRETWDYSMVERRQLVTDLEVQVSFLRLWLGVGATP